jgi:hypothetical protein
MDDTAEDAQVFDTGLLPDPCQASYGILPSMLMVKERFNMYTPSSQKKFDIFLSFSMLLAMPTTV